MRTLPWIFTPAFVLCLAACGDNGGDTDETVGTTSTTSTTTSTTTDGTTTDPSTTTTTTTTTSSTTDTPTTDVSTAGSSSGGGGDLSCDAYCALYETGCKDFSEYDNTQACLDQCSQWPVGMSGAVDGDSLGCRTYHVTVANTADANVHCPHSGPNGGGVCVDPAAPTCADYCTTYLANCTDKLNAYTDEADCLAQCSAWYQGTDGQTAGDTVGCREYHAGVALTDPDVHCPHAGPGGAMVCVVP